MKTMSISDENVYSFLEYYSAGTWVKKSVIDVLVELAKVIRDNPENFNWDEYIETLEKKFILKKDFYIIFNEIKRYLVRREVYQIYNEDSEVKVFVRFYLIVKLQILLLVLNDCEIRNLDICDKNYYNIKDINCINNIFTTLVESNYNIVETELRNFIFELNNFSLNDDIEFSKKSLREEMYRDILFNYFEEIKSLKNKFDNFELFINLFALRYKYLLIGIEMIIFDKNKEAMENVDGKLFH
ncbi:hypothetical protein [Spiroplasma endosymbiont of Aspidapion aeneum]|uniref:hypothetical protein n=1 Tax=Spiroplasma endosymbiont of Aspidapion aeneum TaxID=3066276 RepID=UPI00313B42D2